MNSKVNGFTLIELLAVIVILAVIALIVTPIVTGIIKQAKASADLRSAEGYVKAGEDYYAEATLKNSTLDTNVINSLELSGTPATGSVVVHSDGSVEMAIVINDKCYTKSSTDSIKEITVTSKDKCPIPVLQKVLTAFPELELGDNGCKTLDSTKNYSYMGGCYLNGTQTKNYLWYSGFLWRIMGINADKTIRLITEENVTAISYNVRDNSNFAGSYADSWLNDYFYSRLKNNNIIRNESFCQGAATTNTPTRTDCTGGTTISRNVGLISADEYYLLSGTIIATSIQTDSSYMHTSESFVSMSPYNSSALFSFSNSTDFDDHNSNDSLGIRPVINVDSSSFVTGGDGTLNSTWSSTSSPYILSENKTTDITGNLVDKATSGEYVKLADKTYRVVNKEANGVKLILDGYYQATTGTNTDITYGSNNTFSTTSGIGQTLNTTVLEWLIPSTDTTNRSKLVTNYSWYQNTFTYGDNYTVSLNARSPTRTMQATVGLIRIGEMLSGQSYTILTKNGTVASSWNNASLYWTLNSYTGDASYAWDVNDYGDSNNNDVSFTTGARPVIVVNSTSSITSGNGTPSSPYQI